MGGLFQEVSLRQVHSNQESLRADGGQVRQATRGSLFASRQWILFIHRRLDPHREPGAQVVVRCIVMQFQAVCSLADDLAHEKFRVLSVEHQGSNLVVGWSGVGSRNWGRVTAGCLSSVYFTS